MCDTWAGIIFLVTLIAALALVHKPLGDYMARVLTSKKNLRVEQVIYKVGRHRRRRRPDLEHLPALGALVQRRVGRRSSTCSCGCSITSATRTPCRR